MVYKQLIVPETAGNLRKVYTICTKCRLCSWGIWFTECQ